MVTGAKAGSKDNFHQKIFPPNNTERGREPDNYSVFSSLHLLMLSVCSLLEDTGARGHLAPPLTTHQPEPLFQTISKCNGPTGHKMQVSYVPRFLPTSHPPERMSFVSFCLSRWIVCCSRVELPHILNFSSNNVCYQAARTSPSLLTLVPWLLPQVWLTCFLPS